MTSQLITGTSPSTANDDQTEDRTEPDLNVYADMLLLIDALEQQNSSTLAECETPALINLYTLLSDVRRNAGDLRTDVRELLLDRLHHDQPVHGQYGSVQRTTRRNRSFNDDEDVLRVLEDAGIPCERLMSIDREKVDEALEVTELAESAVYEIDESEYVRKAKVDEDRKETRLQGLKDQLALSDDPKAEQLRTEVAELDSGSRTSRSSRPGRR